MATFSNDEKKTIAAAALQVWNEIGYDCLMATGEETGDGEGATMEKDDVIELVLDASRLEEHIRDRALRARVAADIYGKDSEIEAFLKRDVFKHSTYGL